MRPSIPRRQLLGACSVPRAATHARWSLGSAFTSNLLLNSKGREFLSAFYFCGRVQCVDVLEVQRLQTFQHDDREDSAALASSGGCPLGSDLTRNANIRSAPEENKGKQTHY